MSWILAIIGAVLGAGFGETDNTLLGLVSGATIGALLGQLHALRQRVDGLDAQLARIEDAMRPRAAPPAAAATPIPSPAVPLAWRDAAATPPAPGDAPPGVESRDATPPGAPATTPAAAAPDAPCRRRLPGPWNGRGRPGIPISSSAR